MFILDSGSLSLLKPHWPISFSNSSCSCPPESKDSFFRPQIKCQVLIKTFYDSEKSFIKGSQTLCFSLLWHLPHFHLIFLGNNNTHQVPNRLLQPLMTLYFQFFHVLPTLLFSWSIVKQIPHIKFQGKLFKKIITTPLPKSRKISNSLILSNT